MIKALLVFACVLFIAVHAQSTVYCRLILSLLSAAVTPLTNHQRLTGINVNSGEWQYFSIEVSNAFISLNVEMTREGSVGDPDLYAMICFLFLMAEGMCGLDKCRRLETMTPRILELGLTTWS